MIRLASRSIARKRVRLLELEAFGRVGIDVAETEHGGDHVGAVDERRAGAGGDVEIAGRVDHDDAHDRLTARPWSRRRRHRRDRRRRCACENQLCSRSSTPASCTMSSETRFQPSGSKATA